MADQIHILRTLLQIQLASDSSAVEHLPYTLSHLSKNAFDPSPHLSKWISRVTSLMRSNESGARWAGFCLAYQTSIYSKELMIEYAQGWIGIALPAIAKNDALPTTKAAIRLMQVILTAASDVPEFQRQLATPNATKYSTLLIDLADKSPSLELKILSINSLTSVINQYPTLHRQSYPSLSTLSLKFLNGSSPAPVNAQLLQAATGLYCVLHHTGGKVGAANLWKNSVDETLNFAWGSLSALRTSFSEGNYGHSSSRDSKNPVFSVPRNVDALRCATTILEKLLSTPTQRPVPLSIGPLAQLALAMLRCSMDDPAKENFDSATQVMERSVVPDIWSLGCSLTSTLAQCAGYHLCPHVSRILSTATYQLEQRLTAPQRISFLVMVKEVLANSFLMHSDIAVTRLVKSLLPSLSAILAMQASGTVLSSAPAKSRKGKKRAREYEGDELLRSSKGLIFPVPEEGEVALIALDVLQLLERNPHIAQPARSLASRIFLAVALALPQIPPALLCPDLALHHKISSRIQSLCAGLSSNLSNTMSKSLPMVVQMGSDSHEWDVLLHPRLPPLLQAVPYLEDLSLFRVEESQEETDVREALNISTGNVAAPPEDASAHPTSMQLDIREDKNDARPVVISLSVDRSQKGPVTHPTQSQEAPHPPSQPLTTPSTHPTSLPAHQISQSISAVAPVVNAPTAGPSTSTVVPITVSYHQEAEDEDEEMPSIDMDSDSD
ncbi:hypothetical protein HGRIS_009395 [Hohenbuehelia grisea]|uniref:Pre-rRNA-processing protein RIX1 n=1 Tax=Hohenbuehelia grisea TaxID=104357 RepID=A0ABR3J1I5_9AGAR